MFRQVGVRIADGRQQLVLGLRIEVDQRDRRGAVGRLVGEQRLDQLGRALASRGEVGRPPPAALGDVDAAQEAGDHLAQLVQHELAVLPGLRQRMGPQSEEERFEGLTAAVDADVGQRGRRQDAAHGVERLGSRRLAEHEVAVVGVTGDRGPHVVGDGAEHEAVGVEQPVHVAHVAGPEAAGQHGGISEVAVPPAEPDVVGDVARALLEVAHQPTPLEHLGEDVGRLLAGQVDAAELGDGVVAVLHEHLLVEVLGPPYADRGVDRVISRDVEIADELVDEQPAQALRAAAVAGEQGALDDLRQVDEGEHRPVEIGEVTAQHVGFLGGELLGDVGSHSGRSYGATLRSAARTVTVRHRRLTSTSMPQDDLAQLVAGFEAGQRRLVVGERRRPRRCARRGPGRPAPSPRRTPGSSPSTSR